MLAIRLQRVGRKKQPLYRVVVSEKTKDTYGDHLEILGSYNPHKKEAVLKEDRIKHWLSQGAQSSSSVNNLFIKEGIVEGAKTKSVRISKKRAAKKEDKEAKPEEKSAEGDSAAKPAEDTAEEKPAEEPKEEPKEEKPAEEAK